MVEVIQADRDAAADALEALNVHAWEKSVGHIRAGNADKSYSVQAFARHRLASTPKLTDDAAVERAAEAACIEYWGEDDGWQGQNEAARIRWRTSARAALTALRSPVPRELREALEPLARLEVPKRPVGNAGAYSIRFADIERAKQVYDEITFWLPKSDERREALACAFEEMARKVRGARPETGLD